MFAGRSRRTRSQQPGQTYFHVMPGTVEPDVNADIRVVYDERDPGW
ncbi:MAG: hypothetical protein R3C99_01535 [Pirellulaceae bacterium]